MTWGWPVWRNLVFATVVRQACVSDILVYGGHKVVVTSAILS